MPETGDITNIYGDRVGLPCARAWVMEKLEKCLAPNWCDGISAGCLIGITYSDEAGDTIEKEVKFCDLRIEEESVVSIPDNSFG